MAKLDPPSPTLAELARSTPKRPKDVHPHWLPKHDPNLSYIGAALSMLGIFIAALTFAFALSRLIGGFYIPFLTPLIVGILLASFATMGPRRFRFAKKGPLVAIACTGAFITSLGSWSLGYLYTLDLIASGLPTDAFNSVQHATAAQHHIEILTGQDGLLAYLTYVSQGDGAALSPLGFLGRFHLGPLLTVAALALECLLMALAASWSVLYRTRQLRHPLDNPIAYVAAAHRTAANDALGASKLNALRDLLQPTPEDDGLALIAQPGSASVQLSLYRYDGGALYECQSRRLVPKHIAKHLRPTSTAQG